MKYKNKGRMSSGPGRRVDAASSRDRRLSGGPPRPRRGEAARGARRPGRCEGPGHTAACEAASEPSFCCPLNKTRADKYEMLHTLRLRGRGGGAGLSGLTAGPAPRERTETAGPCSGRFKALLCVPQRERRAALSSPLVGSGAPPAGQRPAVVNGMKGELGTKEENKHLWLKTFN